MDATIKVLKTISQKLNFNLDQFIQISVYSLKKNKTTFPEEILRCVLKWMVLF